MVDMVTETNTSSALPLESNGHDVTPTGYDTLKGVEIGKLKGTTSDEKVTLFNLAQDADQVVFTMGGDDVFVFGVGDKGPSNAGDPKINAIVDMGEGSDTVYLTHFFEDYKFTDRGDDGIKIQYVGSNGDNVGAAVTFRNADIFVFRNIDDSDGSNHINITMDYSQLKEAIKYGFNSDYAFI